LANKASSPSSPTDSFSTSAPTSLLKHKSRGHLFTFPRLALPPGNPRQRAEVTSEILRSTGSTLLFADTHTLSALAALPPTPADAPRLALRGGVVKSGSGADFLPTDGFVYEGVRLLEMGKLKKKAE
jgi:hypothetical protein